MTTKKLSSRRDTLSALVLKNGSQSLSDKAINPEGVHAGLWLDKYIEHLKRDIKAGSQDSNKRTPQQVLVRDVASLAIPDVYKTYYKRWFTHLKNVGAQTREVQTKGRMAVGLGNEEVLDTSVTLHRTYGVPYIPGSALKGLAANYARLLAGDNWQPGGEAYTTVFGNTDSAGFLIFFDALYMPLEERQSSQRQPSGTPECPLRADIITVHHPEYYKGANAKGEPAAPADWDSPNPVPFLSATGCYLLGLAAPDLAVIEPDLDKKWIEKTFDLLKEALLVLGIGAKTSSGYGRMEYASLLSPEAQQIINNIKEMPYIKINSGIQKFYEDWSKLEKSNDRLGVGQEIIKKVRENGYESKKAKLLWYQELVAFVEAQTGGKA